MDQQAFFTGAGFMWTNSNLARSNELLSNLAIEMQRQERDRQWINHLRDVTFALKECLKDLQKDASMVPGSVFYHATTLRRKLNGGGLSAEAFHDFADKEYYVKTCEYADVVLDDASRRLGSKGVQDMKRYFWYEENLESLLRFYFLRDLRSYIVNGSWKSPTYRLWPLWSANAAIVASIAAFLIGCVNRSAIRECLVWSSLAALLCGGVVLGVGYLALEENGREKIDEATLPLRKKFYPNAPRYHTEAEVESELSALAPTLNNKWFSLERYPTNERLWPEIQKMLDDKTRIESQYSGVKAISG